MKYIDAINKFDCSNTVGILVKTDDGNRLLSEHNFCGGSCGCCKDCDDDDNLEVLMVVDVNTMEVFYKAPNMVLLGH